MAHILLLPATPQQFNPFPIPRKYANHVEYGCTGAIPVTHQEAGSKVQPRTVDVRGAKNYPMDFLVAGR
jgi:hypothetical protein